jgi:transglutaminase-like putative cysteine protease
LCLKLANNVLNPVSGAIQQSINRPLATAIQRYFDIALYLLVVTGFATLASTKGLDLPTVLLVTAALLVRGYVLAVRRTLLIPEQWTTALTLGYAAFYVFDYLFLSGQFVSTTVHLVLFLMVMRLFSARRDRDHYFLAVIAFLMVLAAAVLTVDSMFLLSFSVFMLFAVATFILMEMKRTSAQATSRSGEFMGAAASRRLAISLAGVAPVILFLVLLAGAAIFFVLPRISTGYLSAFASSSGITTGFSDHVELGSIGEIQQSGAVVMHIEFDDGQRGTYIEKWRGISLSRFDGTSWSNPYRPSPIRPLANDQFDLRPPETKANASLTFGTGSLIHYHVLMEPVGVNVFFLAPQPQFLQGKYRMIAIDKGSAVFNMDAEHVLGIYDGWSLRSSHQPAVPEEPYPAEALSDYLQLPRLDSRIPQLARQVTAISTGNYEKAVAIQTYLRTKFGYTLQLPSSRPADPLAHFLFNRKSGHCEYFASAMAVMLRTIHIPSRVITGFQPGEFNDITSQYVVRAKDAHAWVEAYFPDRGWVTFDPTPASSGISHTGLGRIALYMDAMASFWREWVVNYDAGHQAALSHEAARNSRQFAEEAQKWARVHYARMLARARNLASRVSGSPVRWGISALLTAIGLLLLINLKRLWRVFREFRLTARPAKSPRLAAGLWYQKMTRKVARRGWLKAESQTPEEFAKSIQEVPLQRQVLEFTKRYESARFGDSAEDAEQLPELYEEIASSRR